MKLKKAVRVKMLLHQKLQTLRTTGDTSLPRCKLHPRLLRAPSEDHGDHTWGLAIVLIESKMLISFDINEMCPSGQVFAIH